MSQFFIKSLLKDFLLLVYPPQCIICERALVKGEKYMCISCVSQMPYLNGYTDNNEIKSKFYGHTVIDASHCFMRYKPGGVLDKCVKNFKYFGYKDLCFQLGVSWANYILHNNESFSYDYIIPVPLHRKKLKKRGYNQSEEIAKGLSSILNIPVAPEVIVRKNNTITQTNKNKSARWENMKDQFEIVDRELLLDKNVLLLDDILTTGATMISCLKTLESVKTKRIGVGTLAVTHFN